MAKLTMEKAKALIAANVTEPHLITHAVAVSSAMGAMAEFKLEKKNFDRRQRFANCGFGSAFVQRGAYDA